MSRDATGIYSAWATEAIACPVCRAAPLERCTIKPGDEAENGTHWARTESAPPYPPPAQIASDDETIEALYVKYLEAGSRIIGGPECNALVAAVDARCEADPSASRDCDLIIAGQKTACCCASPEYQIVWCRFRWPKHGRADE